MSGYEHIINYGKEAVDTEAEALKKLAQSLDEAFARAVEAVLRTEGRVIISGIGKSANVGVKIVATLNSTGTPAVFMHAADATHGDLGIIQPGDIVLIISRSGNTPEIKLLTALVKDLGFPVIALTANKNSFLARQADYLLHTPMDREADPFNLIPTVSTTLQMAMGDALAVAVLRERQFSKEDFAKNHPGGMIGKQLLLKVKDLVDTEQKPSVGPETPVKDVIVEITAKRVGATAVLDNGSLRGIITDGDIRRMLQNNTDIRHIKAADIMSADPKTVSGEALAVEALKKMKQNNINQLIVLDNEGNYNGIIHIHEILKEGII